MMAPMSAVPFGPYGVDQGTMLNMVSTQLEYYFSVENLCKDIFLRKHMDSKGFVYLSVIAEFNRIKQLTTDLELLRFVCYQSPTIEFRVGVDGKDRLRRSEGWEQWVLGMSERDPSAQHDGTVELHNPPMPHPNGFEQLPPYATMSATSPNGHAPFSMMNGVHPGGHQDSPAVSSDKASDGPTTNGVNGVAGSNGHVIEPPTKAVSGEPDSFSDEQVETLTVIVGKQDSQAPPLVPSATRTFSNGSIDSKSGVPDESEKMSCRHSTPKVNGTSPSQG
jgi:la-related protein 1